MPRTTPNKPVSEVELRVHDALEYIKANPESPVATVAKKFSVPRTRLRRRVDGISPKGGRPGHNLKLTNEEEVAICRYIDRLDNINFAVRAEFITDAANHLLLAREGPHASPVGTLWTTRFIKRHGYTRILQRKINTNRKAAEDTQRTREYFNKLWEIIIQYGIPPEDTWNMDETGFRIGIGKNQFIVTKRERLHLFSIPENRESATAIEAISAGGSVIPAFLILSGHVHMDQWYRIPQLQPDTKITLSSSGYSNDQIALSWIKHFDQHATSMSGYRLLILDGHGSHHTKEFITYYEDHKIIPFAMPPHLTHILQPLDMVVFQPLKHYHAKALDIIVRDGVINISKLEFLGLIKGIREKAFKEKTIKSAFKKTGIHPFNPDLIIETLREREAIRTPSPQPSGLYSSDFETPVTLRQINKVADRIEDALNEAEGLDQDLTWNINRFIRGTLIAASELVQTKRDLSHTKKAEQLQQQRRAIKNRPLQSGGTLSVEEARGMVVLREKDALAKARRVVEAADNKIRNLYKRNAIAAAKKARKWRLTKVTDALIISDGSGERLARRG